MSTDFFNMFGYTKNKSTIDQRIAFIDQQTSLCEQSLDCLIEDVSKFMETNYQESIKLHKRKLKRDGVSYYQGVWIFDAIRKKYANVSHTYPLEITNFAKVKGEMRQKLNLLLDTKDDLFMSSINIFEKKRASINKSILMNKQAKIYLETMKKEIKEDVIRGQLCH